jgi:hypothetical protein
MKKYIVCLLLSAGSLMAAEEAPKKGFLDGISLTSEGFYRQDLSNGGGEWGAGLTAGLRLIVL